MKNKKPLIIGACVVLVLILLVSCFGSGTDKIDVKESDKSIENIESKQTEVEKEVEKNRSKKKNRNNLKN